MAQCYCNDGCVLCDPTMTADCPNCATLREDVEVLRSLLKEYEDRGVQKTLDDASQFLPPHITNGGTNDK